MTARPVCVATFDVRAGARVRLSRYIDVPVDGACHTRQVARAARGNPQNSRVSPTPKGQKRVAGALWRAWMVGVHGGGENHAALRRAPSPCYLGLTGFVRGVRYTHCTRDLATWGCAQVEPTPWDGAVMRWCSPQRVFDAPTHGHTLRHLTARCVCLGVFSAVTAGHVLAFRDALGRGRRKRAPGTRLG